MIYIQPWPDTYCDFPIFQAQRAAKEDREQKKTVKLHQCIVDMNREANCKLDAHISHCDLNPDHVGFGLNLPAWKRTFEPVAASVHAIAGSRSSRFTLDPGKSQSLSETKADTHRKDKGEREDIKSHFAIPF